MKEYGRLGHDPKGEVHTRSTVEVCRMRSSGQFACIERNGLWRPCRPRGLVFQIHLTFLLVLAGIQASAPHDLACGHTTAQPRNIETFLRRSTQRCGSRSARVSCSSPIHKPSRHGVQIKSAKALLDQVVCRVLPLDDTNCLRLRGAGDDAGDLPMEDATQMSNPAEEPPQIRVYETSDSDMLDDTSSQIASTPAGTVEYYEQLLEKAELSMSEQEQQEPEPEQVGGGDLVESPVFDADGMGVSKSWNMLTALDDLDINVTVMQLQTHPYTVVELWWDSMGMFRCSYEVRVYL
jgi:hypothetical protein